MARYSRATRPGGPSRRTPAAIKLSSKEGPVATSWVGLRWMRFFESHTDPHIVAEGLVSARQATVRNLDIGHGKVVALLHGRGEPRRTVTLDFSTYNHEIWEILARSSPGTCPVRSRTSSRRSA
jgi:uncharacterized Zn finger protein